MRFYAQEMPSVLLNRMKVSQLDCSNSAVDVETENEYSKSINDHFRFERQINILPLIVKFLNIGLCANLSFDRVEREILNLEIT